MAATETRHITDTPTAIIAGSWVRIRIRLYNLGPCAIDISDDNALEWGGGLRVPPGRLVEVVSDGSLYGIAPPGTPNEARPVVQYRTEEL